MVIDTMMPGEVSAVVGRSAEAMAYAGAMRYYAPRFATHPSHLDVDLADGDRPHLVTRLLAVCLQDAQGLPFAESTLWQWSVGQRLQGLLEIALASGPSRISLRMQCPQSACSEWLELEIDLQRFRQPDAQSEIAFAPDEQHRLRLRLPSGVDLRQWRQAAGPDLEMRMARQLVTDVNGVAPDFDWRLPETWLPALADALQEHDPLTAPTVQAQCPACGQPIRHALDLEGLLLGRLADEQRRTIREVHDLARAYHWAEADIIAMPHWRRQRYLALLDAGYPT